MFGCLYGVIRVKSMFFNKFIFMIDGNSRNLKEMRYT